MTLPLTGQISLRDVNVELGRARTAYIGMGQAETGAYGPINQNSFYRPNGLLPYKMSEWRGYNNNALPQVVICNIYGDAYNVPTAGDQWLQIYDLTADVSVLDQNFPLGTTFSFPPDTYVELIYGHNYRFNLVRDDPNPDYVNGGYTSLSLFNADSSVDLYDYQSFIPPTLGCQSTFDVVIPNLETLTLNFTSDYL